MTILNDGHWKTENYKQRMTVKEWRKMLLLDQDVIIFTGHVRHLQAKKIGAGVVEISKVPIDLREGGES